MEFRPEPLPKETFAKKILANGNTLMTQSVSIANARISALMAFALIMLCCSMVLEAWNNWAVIHNMLIVADKQTMLMLNFKGSAMTDQFWYGYSHMNAWTPLIVTAVASVVYFHPGTWKDKLLLLLSIAILITVLDQVSSSVIKPLTARLRPSHDPSICYLLHYVNDYHGGNFGFVSGHATNIVGITTVLCHIFRNRLTRFTLCLFAVMMCYSRIYLGVHFPGDILCGALLGFTIASLAMRWFGKRMRIYATDSCPYPIIAVFACTLVYLCI